MREILRSGRPRRSGSLSLAMTAVALFCAAAPQDRSAWTVSLQRAGPVYMGASLREASRLLGRQMVDQNGQPARATPGCAYVRPPGGPQAVSFMVHDGVVVRADIRERGVATLSGAKVGDTEQRIHAMYGERIEVRPHKYRPGGHYLVYLPRDPRHREFRLIFETDGKHVTEFRIGRLPEVEWVERCG